MMQQRIRNSKGQHCTVITLPVGQLETNCYIVLVEGLGYVIDPGDDGTYIAETLQATGVTPKAILLTHGHFDHVLAAFEVGMAFSIPTFVHTLDIPILNRMQETAKHFLGYAVIDPVPQNVLSINTSLEMLKAWHISVIPTPGHTPGSVSFTFDSYDMVFTGDTLFADGFVGDTSHSYSDPLQLRTSIRTLMDCSDDCVVFSGHGKETTVREAREQLSKKGFLGR